MLGVPMLREGIPIGVLNLQRTAVRPFTERQIELVTTFADQAVIAIENTRLFEAVQQRTRDLTEALEQQTATSEVLKVISSSPGEVQPVFQAMLENATRICEANFGLDATRGGETLSPVAVTMAAAFLEVRAGEPIQAAPGRPLGRVARTRQVAHIPEFRRRRPT